MKYFKIYYNIIYLKKDIKFDFLWVWIIFLYKLCDLEYKVVLLWWSDWGISFWECYMSGLIDEIIFMCVIEWNNW